VKSMEQLKQEVLASERAILTFGYGNRRSFSELLSYFEDYRVLAVVDIRLSPRAWSRFWYGDSIKERCSDAGVIYLSEPALGNTSGTEEWVPPDFERAHEALRSVAEIARQVNTLLLCAEINHKRCHRTEVALELQKQVALPIIHL